jgi:N-methylhydantoinase B
VSGIDAITLSVLWNGLVSTADEMGTALRRTAWSEAVREGEDFSTGVFDRLGRLVAQGNFSPGHLGSMPYVMRHTLEYFRAETLRPGDGVLLNDSALGSGHYPDLFLVTPAFDGDELIGFAVNCAHHVDVGGAAAGSQVVAGVTEAFQEGLRILPVRFFREGEVEPDLERVLLANVRLPDQVRGDLLAQRSANHLGCLRLAALHRAYGRDVFERAVEQILDRTEEAVRSALRDIPDGRYEFEDHLDDAGPGTEPVRVRVAVTVDGDEMTIDFTGSSPQVPAGMNSYLNYTRAYAVFAMKVLTDPHVPQNDGAFRPLRVVAEPGSFFNPTFPAPSGGRATVQIRIFEAINGAMAEVLPDRVMGAFSHWANPNIGGGDDGSGRPFVMYDLVLGGYGAHAGADGVEALCPVFNARNIPVEVHEASAPVRVERLELIADSGGAGRHRGGCGMRKDVRLLAPAAVLTNLGDRHRFPPYGLRGGLPGRRAETVISSATGSRSAGSKEVVRLVRGDVVSFRTAGGGGYGDPREREREAVRRDLEDGLITHEFARRVYGPADGR